MPLTERLYAKNMGGIVVFPSPSTTPTESPTPSITPSVTPQYSTTPSITPTVSITPTISVTPSPTSTPMYVYIANKYNCITINGQPQCGQFIGQENIYNGGQDFITGYFYRSGSFTYQPISLTVFTSSLRTVDSTTGYTNCILACSSGSITLTPTPTISETPSVTPTISVTPSISITPSVSDTPVPTYTPSLSISNTPTPSVSKTPSVTPSPSSGSL